MIEEIIIIGIIITGIMVVTSLNRIVAIIYLIFIYILSFFFLVKIGFDLMGLIIILSYAGGVLVFFLIFLIHLSNLEYTPINIKKDVTNLFIFFFLSLLIGYMVVKTESNEIITKNTNEMENWTLTIAGGGYEKLIYKIESLLWEEADLIGGKSPNPITKKEELYFDSIRIFGNFSLVLLGVLLYIVMRASIQILNFTKKVNTKRQSSIDQINK
jgi:NADH:ubiquinone oxidoreductase subunit 6 (subunit J)